MNTASVTVSEDWEVEDGAYKPASLVIQFRRQALVLPWFRFAYAFGSDKKVDIVFSDRLVIVEGNGLLALLDAVATHRVSRITQPTENEAKFGVRGEGARAYTGSAITSIEIEEV